jgi:hypothetical protein
MRLRSSGGYNTNDLAPHRAGDEDHPAVDQANSVETQLASGIAVIELDHIRVQERNIVLSTSPQSANAPRPPSILRPLRFITGAERNDSDEHECELLLRHGRVS